MNLLDAAMYGKLAGGTALTALIGGTAAPRIYHLQAPEGAVLPYVVFGLQGGGDENFSPHRTKNMVEFVRAYSGVSASEAGTIDAQIDPLLHNQSLSVTGWTSVYTVREQDLELVENPPSGSAVYMNGGMYRVVIDRN